MNHQEQPQDPRVLPGYFSPAQAPPQPAPAPPRVEQSATYQMRPPAFVNLPLKPSLHPVPLSAPLHAATFGQSVGRFFRKYSTFSGRAGKAEFWWVTVFMAGTFLASALLSVLIRGNVVAGLYGVFLLASIIPALALTVRRLHDANLSGSLLFLALVPYVGFPIVLILSAMRSSPAGARFDKQQLQPQQQHPHNNQPPRGF
ncbi:DUF805 domain-containing protein [Arthrobacter sp. LAPM80]|uniref:DUF805 domain-containing protein n=1 Tax=Arthrobacter sp. LAPM80 TaxID=3141788 RepID=UPI00398B82B0